MSFQPFDTEYNFDKNVLTEDFPEYLLPSVTNWITKVLDNHNLLQWTTGKQYISYDQFILPLNEALRLNFSSGLPIFLFNIKSNPKILRNVLSYMLQSIATKSEGQKLEKTLSVTGSAYAVQISEEKVPDGWTKINMKLIYRVSKIVSEQGAPVLNLSELIREGWDAYYGLKPDYEKVVTRCSDALAGIIKEKFFPAEKKPQLGKLLGQLLQKPKAYSFPGESIINKEEFLGLMDKFTSIRGDHRTGTGRKPTKEEAKFVLHYTITFFHLLELN